MRLSRSLSWVFCILLLAGCAPVVSSFPVEVTASPVPPTATSTPTITPTPTIVWFPATATPTPLPTIPQTPTPDLKPVGALLYLDDFTNPDNWIISAAPGGNVLIMNGDITLAADQDAGMSSGIRSAPLLTDLYAEITASPNFCAPGDEYGLMLRVTGAQRDHYRFTVTCDGNAALFRVVNQRPLQIAAWTAHPLLPDSFPAEIRLGAWLQGRELRLFVNDVLLFSAQDAVILRGAVGVFVKAGSGAPVSVNFSDLHVYELPGGEE